MPEEVETVNLQGLGDNKDEGRNARRRRQAPARNKRVIVIGVLVTACIIILVIAGAWFIYTTVSDSHPEWLQTIPGLHYRPSSTVRDTLIMFRSTDEISYQPWVQVIDDFLKDYTQVNTSNALVHCDYSHPPQPGSACFIDVRTFHGCSHDNNYGYHRGSPCIFLKMHKFVNWVPEYYNVTELPDSMPQHLRNYIQRSPPAQLQTVWLSCEGQTASDQEFIGPMTYFPRMGFPGYFFPYKNTEGYLSPLVAIQLERPRNGIIIYIECKLWAKNIIHDREKGIGIVHFQIMID